MENYLEQTVIGRGQFGTVSLAKRLSDLKLVVIKKIPLDSSDPKERDSALNEARLLKVLDHPNIIQYFESFIGERDTLMIVMEYARGGTLANFLAQQSGQFVDEETLLPLFSQMVLAIAYIHARNILHRDLKPQNIMLDETMRIVKLGDFGISTVLTTKTKATTVVGTPNYLGPEVCEGRPYDSKSDIWSLGCVLFEMTALRRAFDGSNLGAIVNLIQKAKLKQPVPPHYPEYLKKLVNWLLEKNPHYRPTAAQVIAYPPVMLATAKVVCSVGKILALPSQLGEGSRPPGFSLPRQESSVYPDEASARVRKRQQCVLVTADGTFNLPTKPMHLIGAVALGRDVIAGVFSGSGKPFVWEEVDRFAENTEFSLRSLHLDVNLVVTNVACGENFVVALSERGLVLTTGSGCFGCLGHGSFLDMAGSWRIVDGLLGSRIVAVACGSRHVLAAGEDGELFGWGESSSGRLGHFLDGSQIGAEGTTMMTSPKKVDTSRANNDESTKSDLKITKIYCGNDCSCILFENVENPASFILAGTGSNRANRLLIGKSQQVCLDFTAITLPSSLVAGKRVDKICFGLKHSVLLLTDGNVYGWGDNSQKQLFDDDRKLVENVESLLSPSELATDVCSGDFFTAILPKGGNALQIRGESMLECYQQWSQDATKQTNDASEITSISILAAGESKLLVVECHSTPENSTTATSY